MKVAIFGGTGFVGSYLCDELIEHEHYVSLFVRDKSFVKTFNKSMYVDIVTGDINNNEDIKRNIQGCDVVIYSIGILRAFPSRGITFENAHFEIAKKCIDIANNVGVKRFIMISANGAKLEGTAYQRTKFLAEEYLRKSNLTYTIFRPSVIFGDPKYPSHREFTTTLLETIINPPIFAPSFFERLEFYKAGQSQLAPVFIKDVAKAIIGSISKEECENETYHMCGKKLTWSEIINIIAMANHKEKVLIPVPVWIVKIVASIFERFSFFPVSKDELTMLMQGNTCNEDKKDIFKILNISKKIFGVSTLTKTGFEK